MFKIWLINFGWYLSDSFDNVLTAIDYGKSKGFEFRVDSKDKMICAWSPISGLRYF